MLKHRLDIKKTGKSHFVGLLLLTPVGKRLWEVRSDFAFVDFSGNAIITHVGDRTDLASIPWFLHAWLPPDDTYTDAAVIHDKAYRDSRVYRYDQKGVCTDIWTANRKFCDDLFLRAMTIPPTPTPERKRRIIYRTVRMCGWWPWRKNRKAK